MSEEKKLGVPIQSTYTQDELCELIKDNQLTRGTYVLDVSGVGNFKISRLAKQWIQK